MERRINWLRAQQIDKALAMQRAFGLKTAVEFLRRRGVDACEAARILAQPGKRRQF
jgi:hypothetical protein